MTVNNAREFQTETLPETVLTPLKWDFCFIPRKQTSLSYVADCDVIACYGGAKLTDKHLASKISICLTGVRDEFHLAAIVQNLKTMALRLVGPPTRGACAAIA